MKTNRELRAEARAALSGRWTNPVLATLLCSIIGALGYLFLLGHASTMSFITYIIVLIIILFIAIPIGFSYVQAFLPFFRKEEKMELSDLLACFSTYGKALGAPLLVSFYITLWSLLLYIPGIIKSYSYAMTFYILKDNPELSVEKAIQRSMVMMDGYKWKLFCLHLSFIGWYFLCVLSFGIGILWLNPYIQTSAAAFYEDIKGEVAFVQEEA